MDRGFRIGRIFGINIRIAWSWLLIFVLVTWNLSAVFGSTHSNWGAARSWGLALAASLLFFASVLAHEIAHSLVARARGIPVRSITLFLFGGVSNIQQEPPSAGVEFWMALVGPLTSIVLGGLLLLGGVASAGNLRLATQNATNFVSSMGPLTTILVWLGSINIFLGLFNLLPAFPLDGGRVLRSIFWGISNNLRRATRWAAWIGQGIAWIMILVGVAMFFGLSIPLLGSGFISGLWLIFIGWFLNSSASQSYRQVVIQDVLEDVPVERMMRANPPTVSPDTSVDRLVHEHIMGSDDHGFPVLRDNQLVGIVCLHDVRKLDRDRWDTTPIQQIMTPTNELVTVTPQEDASEALNKMQQRDVRQLPVVQDGNLVGVLRRRDILQYLQMQSDRV